MTTKTQSLQARDAILATFRAHLVELDHQISMNSGVINGTPFVVEVCPGLYLHGANAEGQQFSGGLGVGLITYDRASAEERAAAARANSQVWASARVLHIKDALASEREQTAKLIEQIAA